MLVTALVVVVAAFFFVVGAALVLSADHRERFIGSRWPDRLASGNMRTPGRARILGLWWMVFGVFAVLLTFDVV